MKLGQHAKQCLLPILFVLQAHAGVGEICHSQVEKFFNKTLNQYKSEAAEVSAKVKTPRLVNPKEELGIVDQWTDVKQPKIYRGILPQDTHIINHSLNGANEEGVVKTNGGIMAHIRGYVRGIGTNFGVNFYALMDNLFRKEKSFVRSDAEAVVIFVHGGGTKTTGHHVAASLMNYLNPYKVDVLSFDLPWHGEGPRNSVENAADTIKLVREYIEKYVAVSGKPVFLAGHSMGGVFSDVYRRMYPNDKLIKGVMSLSTVADVAPGKSIEEKRAAEMIIEEFNRTNPNIPEDDRDLSATLARQNKIAPLCGAFCSTFMAELDWALPAHKGSDYIPALYVIGDGDALHQGYQKSFQEFVGELKNTELVVYGERKLFGKLKSKITFNDESLPRDVKKKIQNGNYFGDADPKKVEKMLPHERFELRNAVLKKLKSEGKISFDETIPFAELFENDPVAIGHLIFDHKPLVTFSSDVPDEIRKRIMAANYYGDIKTEQVIKMSEPQKIEAREKALLKLRDEGKVSWDARYEVDDLNQIETFVLMRQFVEKNIGKKLKSHRQLDIKPIYGVIQAYTNNLVFRQFADHYVYNHLRASEIISKLGPERGVLTQELNALNKKTDKTEADFLRIKEIQTRIGVIASIVERKKAKNPKDQAELDRILGEMSNLNVEITNLNKERSELRNNKEKGLDAVLRADLSAIEKQIVALGENLKTPGLIAARENREKLFDQLMDQDMKVRLALNDFLNSHMENGKYLPNLFENLPDSVQSEFEKYEELANLYQESVRKFSQTLYHDIVHATPESVELARQYEVAAQKVNTSLQKLDHIDRALAALATKSFKLDAKRTFLTGEEHFKSEYYTVWEILNSDPELIKENYTEVNSILMNIWKEWQSLWGNRIAETNESLY